MITYRWRAMRAIRKHRAWLDRVQASLDAQYPGWVVAETSVTMPDGHEIHLVRQ